MVSSMQSTGKSHGVPDNSPGLQLLQELEALNQVLNRTGSASLRQQTGKFQNPVTKDSGSASRLNESLSRFPSKKGGFQKLNEKPENQSRKPGKNPPEKKSFWDWKSLKALAHIGGRHRLGCEFSLRVHSVEGLPSNLNGLNLCTHWRRREGGVKTKPARVSHGLAKFEETLYHKCSVYGSRIGPNQHMRYEAKFFDLSVTVLGLEERELCRHKVDLSRMLPPDFDGEEKRVDSWNTSFKLTGKEARGGQLFVTITYKILDREMGEASSGMSLNSGKISRPNLSNPTNPNVGIKTGVGVADALDWKPMRSSGGVPVRKASYTGDSEDPSILCPGADLGLDQIDRMSNLSLDDHNNMDPGQFEARNVVSLYDFKPRLKFFLQTDGSGDARDVGDARDGHNEDDGSIVDEENAEFSVIEKGLEIGNVKLEHRDEDEGKENGGKLEKDEGSKEIEVPSAAGQLDKVEVASVRETMAGNSQLEQTGGCEQSIGLEDNKEDVNLPDTCSLDDVADSVAGEFLSMLEHDKSPLLMSSDSDPESPRARLLKQFERESLLEGSGFGLGLGVAKQLDEGPSHSSALQRYDSGSQLNWELDEDLELASIVQAAESELQKAAQTVRSKTRAKILEDAENEALMQEWGMNERAFQNSPPDSSGGFGSPIRFPFEPVELPDLGEGFGPLVKTKDGGLLRSMNPVLFHNSKNKGSLVMQVSNPVVVPAELGSNVMDVLRHLASFGIEKLTVEAKKIMPLEDITGKTIQQVAMETVPSLEGSRNRQPTLQVPAVEKGSELELAHLDDSRQMDVLEYRSGAKLGGSKSKSSCMANMYAEYVSLDEIAPQALEKIEALSLEGLKIQSDMTDQDAPSNVNAMSLGGVTAFEGLDSKKKSSLGLEGTAGLQLLDTKESGNDSDSLLGMTITLDEWMKLDAGIVDEEESSERTSKILAAHHAVCSDLVVGEKGGKRRGKQSTRRGGFMGNILTIAFLVQLRDPLRNFESVGAPMMAFVQAERIVVPPRPKMGKRVSEKGNSVEIDESESEDDKKGEVSQFKITEVHVAGLKPQEENKKTGWSNSKQQQSASRWLIASGMGKSAKHPVLKSKKGAKTMLPSKMTVKPGDTLWSISARINGDGERWKDVAALNPHIRNPDVIFPNQTIRIR